MSKFIRKIYFFIIFVLFFNTSFSQNKKKQIENLSHVKDSLEIVIKNNLFLAENNLLKAQNEIARYKANYDSLMLVLLNERSTRVEKNKILNEKLSSAQDSFNYYKKEYQNLISSKDSIKSNSEDYNKKEELGNLIIFYKRENKFINGEPNEYWNGDYFEDIICTYFIKEGNSNRQVELQECFNDNVNELLSKINILAKKQFVEDKEIVKQCGGNLKLPLKLSDLEMHVDSDFICFEYEVGLWKGNNCGLPRDRVCFEKPLIKKYIKGF
jgi:hypothetical protein